jgi:hypothetical protein
MRYFHVINTRHKGVPTDGVDRHLLSMREAEGTALLEREGERSYLRARATMLADMLNDDPASPWKGMIRMPGEPLRRSTRCASTAWYRLWVGGERCPDQAGLGREAAKLLLNYWTAARDLWGSAFAAPQVCDQRPLGAARCTRSSRRPGFRRAADD